MGTWGVPGINKYFLHTFPISIKEILLRIIRLYFVTTEKYERFQLYSTCGDNIDNS